jgi:hypothetical protein
MAENKWPEAKVTPYTQRQKAEKEASEAVADQDHAEKITSRPQESVDETVELLRQLLTMPEVADLCIELIWMLGKRGATRHLRTETGNPAPGKHLIVYPYDAPERHRGRQGQITTFRLGRDGLTHYINYLTSWPAGEWEESWEQIDPSEHADLVRRFEIYPTQVNFLIDQLKA